MSALITPQLVDEVDIFSAERSHSSGGSQQLIDCHVEPWGLSFECETPDDPAYDTESVWLLSALGLRLSQRRPRSRHARRGPSVLTAVTVTHDTRSWRTADLLLGLAVAGGTPARIVGAEEFSAATAGGLLRPGDVNVALWRVHQTLQELTEHNHDLSGWLAFQGIHDPWPAR